MNLNETASANRINIGIFGKRNAGKSSLINAVTRQKAAIVSDIKGTTTDPVYKAMEILPIGPVMIIDTPGIDDDGGELGKIRVNSSYKVLDKTDIALAVVDGNTLSPDDAMLIDKIKEKNIPYIIVYNKCDTYDNIKTLSSNEIAVSAKNNINIEKLCNMIAGLAPDEKEKKILDGLAEKGDIVVLVVPIDSSAPKGRLIMPQQQTIREILDTHACAVCVQPQELEGVMEIFGDKIKLVVTDSQAFNEVSEIVPGNITLTSFSILMARYKGIFSYSLKCIEELDNISDGSKILIAEGCTHHRQCKDIGTVKIPEWIEKYTKKRVEFDFCSGKEFPDDLSEYKMIIHCGGCMLGERELQNRMKQAEMQGIPMTNYGMLIAKVNGIFERCTKILTAGRS